MGRPLQTDVIGSPTRWMIVFDREAASWWTNFIAFGHYKHVRAFGYVHEADAYLFYDVKFGGTVLQIARGDGARALMLEWTANADVLRWDGRVSAQLPGTFPTILVFPPPDLHHRDRAPPGDARCFAAERLLSPVSGERSDSDPWAHPPRHPPPSRTRCSTS